MSFMVAFTLIIAASLGVIVYLANVQQNSPKQPGAFNLLLYAVTTLTVANGALTLFAAISSSALPDDVGITVDIRSAAIFALFAAAAGLLSVLLIRWRGVRDWVARSVFRSDGKRVRYDPASPVHTTAIVLAILLIVGTVGNFVLAGGIEGLAQDYAQSVQLVETLLVNFLLYALFSLLGVGLFLRRDIGQTLQRLGLNRVWLSHIGLGAVAGLLLYALQFGLIAGWASFAPDSLTQQSSAAQELFNLFSGSLLLGLLLAVTTGIGEELFFRGALQPIFGIFWTSIFFVLLHSQYILTFASLVIFLVSIGFGLLARRFSTVTAMVAHVVYNFIPFLIVWFAGQMGVSL
jgi:membrane protease YdiL (CAAX protease family)